jgi:hypothetical protein
MAEGDKWYRCLITEGMHCRGVEQAQWHLVCHRNPALKRNAGLDLASYYQEMWSTELPSTDNREMYPH